MKEVPEIVKQLREEDQAAQQAQTIANTSQQIIEELPADNIDDYESQADDIKKIQESIAFADPVSYTHLTLPTN